MAPVNNNNNNGDGNGGGDPQNDQGVSALTYFFIFIGSILFFRSLSTAREVY